MGGARNLRRAKHRGNPRLAGQDRSQDVATPAEGEGARVYKVRFSSPAARAAEGPTEGPTNSPTPATAARSSRGLTNLAADEDAAPCQGRVTKSRQEQRFVLKPEQGTQESGSPVR